MYQEPISALLGRVVTIVVYGIVGPSFGALVVPFEDRAVSVPFTTVSQLSCRSISTRASG